MDGTDQLRRDILKSSGEKEFKHRNGERYKFCSDVACAIAENTHPHQGVNHQHEN